MPENNDYRGNDMYYQPLVSAIKRLGLKSLEVCPLCANLKKNVNHCRNNLCCPGFTLRQRGHDKLVCVMPLSQGNYFSKLIAFSSCGSLPLCNALMSNGTSTSGGNPTPSYILLSRYLKAAEEVETCRKPGI